MGKALQAPVRAGLRRELLGTEPSVAAVAAVVDHAAEGFLLAGRWGLPDGAPADARALVAGVEPAWSLPAGADPFAAIDEVDAVRGQATEGAIGGGLVGWLGFELSRHVERTLGTQPPRPAPLPEAQLSWYADVLRRDPSGDWWVEALVGDDDDEADALLRSAVDRWRVRLAGGAPAPRPGRLAAMRLATADDGAAHQAAVAETIERIRAGELFQANICLRLEGRLEGSLGGLVEAVLARTDPWYGGWFKAPDGRAILSASPELFLRRRGHAVSTGPIKGTLPRTDGATDPSHDPVASALLASVKDRAEHVMIVDLMRNDLGRVCEYGSIAADPTPTAEPHAGVWHLVSTVRGQLHEGFRDGRLLRATFPPGSVTGAPKVQAMRVIGAVEGSGREAYTGAHGLLSPVSGLDLGVTIRTLEVRGSQAWVGVGGGIVSDSVPRAELDEALGKAAALLAAAGSQITVAPPLAAGARAGAVPAIPAGTPWVPSAARRPDPAAGLLETVRVDHGQPVHLDRHLGRLRASAATLGIPVPRELPEQLADLLREGPAPTGRLRIELLPGEPALVEAVPFSAVPADGVLLAPVVVPGGLGPHKWRDRSLLAALGGLVDGATPLLLDATGEVLEAAWANLWWEGPDGRLLTPDAGDRVLPGIARAALLEALDADGAALAPPPLLAELTDRPLLLSSARGLTPARLASSWPAAIARAAQLAAALSGTLADG